LVRSFEVGARHFSQSFSCPVRLLCFEVSIFIVVIIIVGIVDIVVIVIVIVVVIGGSK
jgi:hypothetical protein